MFKMLTLEHVVKKDKVQPQCSICVVQSLCSIFKNETLWQIENKMCPKSINGPIEIRFLHKNIRHRKYMITILFIETESWS